MLLSLNIVLTPNFKRTIHVELDIMDSECQAIRKIEVE